MIDATGLSLAIFAALFFGTYYVPLKRSNGIDPQTYQSFVGIGALIVGIIASFLLAIPFQLNIAALLPGIIWAIGNLIGADGVKYIGVSGLPIGQAVVLLVSFLWGVIFFRESFQSLLLAVIGISLLISGLPLISIGHIGNKNKKRGFALFAIAGALWGSVYVAPLAFKVQAKSIVPSILLGVFLAGAVLFLAGGRRFEKENALNSMISGAIWATGSVAATLSLDLLGIALAGPLPQLAILVSIAWGIFYFKEVEERHRIAKVIVGGIVLVSGAILLALAK